MAIGVRARLQQLWERPLAAAPVLVALATAAIAALWQAGALQPMDLFAYDAFARWRSAAAKIDERVVLVGATEEDLERYDWPVADGVLADLLAAILAQQPRAIAVDIYRGKPRPPHSQRLAALLERHTNVVMVAKFGERSGHSTAPPAVLRHRPERVGFADVVEDHDGVARRGLLFLDDGATVASSLPLRAAARYLAAEGIRMASGEHPEELRLGRATLRPLEANDGPYIGADAAGYQFLLDFAGGRQPFRAWAFADVLDGKAPAQAFHDRMVLVGVTARSVKDFFATPFREGRGAVEPVYGVALHAHAAGQLVRMARGESPTMRVLSEWAEALWILGWTAAGALLALVRSRAALAVAALGGAAAAVGASYAAFHSYTWLPAAGPLLGFLAAGGALTAYLRAHESAQRATLMRIFSRYVSKPLAQDIWNNRRELLERGRLAPRRMQATVMFTDIRGFTSISEKLSPAELMDWLSEYLGRMAEVVHENGGVVEKFMGDGIMAAFGIHGPRAAEHARQAVDCALAMRRTLEEMNPAWQAKGMATVGIRVGIHTGPVAYGTVGHGERVESTVLGDTTNTASRLESLKQDSDAPTIEADDPEDPDTLCRILVSAETLRLLDGKYGHWIVGPVQLKGKSDPVQVYGIRGRAC